MAASGRGDGSSSACSEHHRLHGGRRRHPGDVFGEIDVDGSDELLDCLVDAVRDRRPPRLIVDMLHVTFIDSVGLSAVLAGHRVARGIGVVFMVQRPNQFVARQMHVTGIYDTLTSG